MLTEHDYPVHLSVDMARYRPPAAARPARLDIDLIVDRDRNPATSARLRTAEERLHSDSEQVAASFNSAATRHLQEQTRTSARIADDGYALTIGMDIPAAPAPARQHPAGGKTRPTLTAEQEDLLPSLRTAISASLPVNERHRADSLALQAIQEIPPAAGVIKAYDQVQVDEVINEHIRRMEDYTQMPIPASIRLAELSFPQPASAALNYHHPNTSPAAVSVPRSPRTSTDIER